MRISRGFESAAVFYNVMKSLVWLFAAMTLLLAACETTRPEQSFEIGAPTKGETYGPLGKEHVL